MSEELLPLFPLRLVAFPGSRIPLHIFEDRYKDMIGKAIADNSEFGIVLSEEQGIVSIGCTVIVEEVLKRYPDGRLDILCRGMRRFEIVSLREENDCLAAQVRYFADEKSKAEPALCAEAIASWRDVKALLHEGQTEEEEPEGKRLGFALAERVPDLNVRQVLLQVRDEEERLRQLIGYFSEFEERQARVAHARRVAPTNGHGPLVRENDAGKPGNG